MPVQSIAPGVILLKSDAGDLIVCDEYYPEDGRVHILGESCYGEFDRTLHALEYRKAVLDIPMIVYEGPDWPEPIKGCKDVALITAHFNKD